MMAVSLEVVNTQYRLAFVYMTHDNEALTPSLRKLDMEAKVRGKSLNVCMCGSTGINGRVE